MENASPPPPELLELRRTIREYAAVGDVDEAVIAFQEAPLEHISFPIAQDVHRMVNQRAERTGRPAVQSSIAIWRRYLQKLPTHKGTAKRLVAEFKGRPELYNLLTTIFTAELQAPLVKYRCLAALLLKDDRRYEDATRVVLPACEPHHIAEEKRLRQLVVLLAAHRAQVREATETLQHVVHILLDRQPLPLLKRLHRFEPIVDALERDFSYDRYRSSASAEAIADARPVNRGARTAVYHPKAPDPRQFRKKDRR